MLTKRQFLYTGGAFLSLAGFGPRAYAHRLKQATSRVTWQDDLKSLEITHILHLHDAALALSSQGLLEHPDLTPLKARAQLALYTRDHFKVYALGKTIMPLETLGAEIEGGQIYVYQEASLPKQPAGLIIEDSILLDVFPAQVNMVNVNLSGAIKTLQFERGDTSKKVLA